MSEDFTTLNEVNKHAEQKVEEFEKLLEKIEYAANETKKLWKEIYQNAVDDRTRAIVLFADLSRSVMGDSNGHVMHARSMNDYLSKMNKANDQLLKLAELIESASDTASGIDSEDVYDQIAKENKV